MCECMYPILCFCVCCCFRFVVVPLAALCSFCPKIAELSGNLSNLRRLLMDQPQVKLSQDGFSLLVKCEEQGTASLLQNVNCVICIETFLVQILSVEHNFN